MSPGYQQDTRQAMRLNRILSSAGLTSRRGADQLIREGRVRVNGQPVKELGTVALWGLDRIEVDGRLVPQPFERCHLMLNKPFGYVCSLKDPEGRPLVIDLLRGVSQRVYPVGRLDFDTLGLLLLTNDGDWAYRLTHPKYRVPRTYKVTVDAKITDHALGLLRKGIPLKDGPSGPSRTCLIARNQRQSIIRITITQGRNRQVRRMMDAVGYKVVHLTRIAFGNLRLGDLKVGQYRRLESYEVKSMKSLVGLA